MRNPKNPKKNQKKQPLPKSRQRTPQPRFVAPQTRRHQDSELLQEDQRKTLTRFVHQFAHGTTFMAKVHQMAGILRSFQPLALPINVIQETWANRSATDIIRSHTLHTLKGPEAKTKNVEGCMDVGIALVAVGRKLAELENAPATVQLARWKTHTWVRVDVGNQHFLVDTLKDREIDLSNEHIREIVQQAIAKGEYTEGNGPRAIGLHSLQDFKKYGGIDHTGEKK